MKRRDFTAMSLAAGLATPQIVKANIENDRDRSLPDARVTIYDLNIRVEVRFLVVADKFNETIGIDLNQPVRQVSEDKADLSEIPLLGDLLNNLSARAAAADPNGKTYLWRDLLFVIPDDGVINRPPRVTVSHQNVTYILPRPRVMRFQGIPFVEELPFLAKLVGETRQDDDGLMIFVTPTVVLDNLRT